MGIKLDCGACGSNNLYYTEENGKYYCFSCGYFKQDGAFVPPQRSLHIPEIRRLYTELSNYYHSCLDENHTNYLVTRGMSIQDIARYRIGYVPNDIHILYRNEIALESGLVTKQHKPRLAGRIVFPYWVKDKVTDIRGRTFDCISDKKYLSPKGSGYSRGADYPYDYESLTHDIVVITEGEIKSRLSNSVDVPCVAIPGIVSMRPMLKQRKGQTFIVCFDTPATNDTIRAIYKLAQHFDNLKVATLPTTGDKQDIDSFILKYGELRYKTVIDRALPFDMWKKLVI